MIQVHDTFICKPGNASKMAKLIKENMPFDPKKGPYVLTDMTGQYHRVTMITNYDNLADYEKSFELYQNPTPEMKAAMEKMGNMQEMYTSGSREIFKVW